MQGIRLTAALLVAAFLAATWSDTPAANRRPWHNYQAIVDAFYEKPLKERLAAFPQYKFEEQYAIYLYGNQVQHPPAIYLADPFAAEGKSVVRPLSSRLMAATDDLTIRDLVMVFSAMSRQKSYDVTGDQQLMNLLKDSAGRMKDVDWRRLVEKEVSSLEAARRQQQPTAPSN
jgi:hypothetical protein